MATSVFLTELLRKAPFMKDICSQKEVDNIEIEEFYPSAKVDLNYNSSELEAVYQGVLIKLIQIILCKRF